MAGQLSFADVLALTEPRAPADPTQNPFEGLFEVVQDFMPARPACFNCTTPTGCELVLVADTTTRLPCCFSRDRGCDAAATARGASA